MKLEELLDEPIKMSPTEIKAINDLAKLLLTSDSVHDGVIVIVPHDLMIPVSMAIAAGMEALTGSPYQQQKGEKG